MEATNISRTSFMARNGVASFVLLTFAISYLLGVPFNMFLSPRVKDTNEVFSVLLPRLITVYAPAIAAVVVTLFTGAPFSTKTLLRKLIPKSRHAWWCIGLPLMFVFVTFTSYAIAGVPVTQLADFLIRDWYWLILQLVVQFFIVGIGEELGWRGWLLPMLAERQSLIRCVLSIVLIWGLWHFPIFLGGIEIVIPWLMILVAMAFLTTGLWCKVDGNIFVLAIMHASFNASVAFLENRLHEIKGGQDLIAAGWSTIGYVYLLIAFLMVMSARKIWAARSM